MADNEFIIKIKALVGDAVAKIKGLSSANKQLTTTTNQASKATQKSEQANKKDADAKAKNQKATSSLVGVMGKLKGIIAGYIGLNFAKKLLGEADAMAKYARRMGTSVEEVSELAFVAERSGIATSALATSMQRVNRRAVEAKNGSAGLAEVFNGLSIDASEFIKLPMGDQLELIAGRMEGVDNAAQKTAIAFKLFDTEGVTMLQAMENGAEGIKGLRSELRNLGGVITTEFATQAETFNDAMTNLSSSVKGAGREILSILLPSLIKLADGITNAVVMLRELSGNPMAKLIGQSALVAGGVFALSKAFLIARNSAIGLGLAIKGLTRSNAILLALSLAVGGLIKIFGKLNQVERDREKALEQANKDMDIANALITEGLTLSGKIGREKIVEGLRRQKNALKIKKENAEYERQNLLLERQKLSKKIEKAQNPSLLRKLVPFGSAATAVRTALLKKKHDELNESLVKTEDNYNNINNEIKVNEKALANTSEFIAKKRKELDVLLGGYGGADNDTSKKLAEDIKALARSYETEISIRDKYERQITELMKEYNLSRAEVERQLKEQGLNIDAVIEEERQKEFAKKEELYQKDLQALSSKYAKELGIKEQFNQAILQQMEEHGKSREEVIADLRSRGVDLGDIQQDYVDEQLATLESGNEAKLSAVQQYYARLTEIIATAGLEGAETIQSIIDENPQAKGIFDAAVVKDEAAFEKEIEALQSQLEAKEITVEEHRQRLLEVQALYANQEMSLEQKTQNAINKARKTALSQRLDMAFEEAKLIVNITQSLFSIIGAFGVKNFKFEKGLRLAEAVINTAREVSKVVSNPPLAAAVGLAGAAQIVAIATQKEPKKEAPPAVDIKRPAFAIGGIARLGAGEEALVGEMGQEILQGLGNGLVRVVNNEQARTEGSLESRSPNFHIINNITLDGQDIASSTRSIIQELNRENI